RLIARDALATTLVYSAAVIVVVPLAMVIAYVAYQGYSLIAPHFFVDDVSHCGFLSSPSCGGVGHAIIGTLEQVGIAVIFAVPLAMLCAIFLSEIGGPLRRPVFLFVDAMSGIPSIVAGLFIYAVWVVGLQRGFNGFGASLALTIMMLPTVTRTAFEVLRLVPSGLREGAYALGASEWRTTLSVVLPTARSGLITAIVLGVARAVGETAPLIFTAFGAQVTNVNPFVGPQEALPRFIYSNIHYPQGSGPYQQAWGAALVLTFLVLALFTLARVGGGLLSVERRQKRAARRQRREQRRGLMEAEA
ncbi:MAG: phosphate ABC transporter permease PstA, partial [Candidatus Dormibacteraeota bacterium]|nr:phosphate ABC transporter permease PstA [Candidatus Dormibacteraeota bacterium]